LIFKLGIRLDYLIWFVNLNGLLKLPFYYLIGREYFALGLLLLIADDVLFYSTACIQIFHGDGLILSRLLNLTSVLLVLFHLFLFKVLQTLGMNMLRHQV